MMTDIKFYVTEALFELLKTKDLKNIKIVELSKLSGISRTTFYNNFNNINDVLDYKFNNIINDIDKKIKLNNFRNKSIKDLLIEIMKYIDKNKNTFLIIKNKLFFDFKAYLDNKFYNNNYEYYIKSGIIINLCILYIENDFKLDLDKIKIDY